ncbi:hypothetical protein H4W26_002668 [Nesterenkonia halotolerans]|uniref:Uncharacterized protein n=1 Tax=Nesterenkonia halotolerans TaxID=225325 RepID=A0ABR9JBF8_9MICC|nr:hypothetical protein [Nesterenkonia halotolerans]
MQRTYVIEIALAISAYFLTIYNIFTFFDSSIVVVSLIVLLAIPASIYIKLSLNRDIKVKKSGYYAGLLVIILSFFSTVIYGSLHIYAIAAQIVAWSAIAVFLLITKEKTSKTA